MYIKEYDDICKHLDSCDVCKYADDCLTFEEDEDDFDETFGCELEYEFDDEDEEDSNGKTVYVTMSIIDEFGHTQSLSCSYDWNGNRKIEQGEDLLAQLGAFMKAAEFHRVITENDIEFVV